MTVYVSKLTESANLWDVDLPNLGLASTDPGAILVEAYMKLCRNDYNFYDYIKCIGENMKDAVDQCLSIALEHQDAQIQKLFLKAASMGIRLCNGYDSSKFAQVIKKLRVLNSVRQMNIPCELTVGDFQISSLIDRLINKNHWPLAIAICNFMDVPMEEGVYRILAHWCLSIMDTYKQNKNSSLTEEIVARKIFGRLEKYPLISYADIAEVAARNKLPNLASILLEKEAKVSRQVTVLLKLDQTEKALQKAIQSHQPDLVHIVLRRMRDTKSSSEIELLLTKLPDVYSLYQSSLFEEVPDRVLTLYEQNDDFVRQSIYYLKKGEECNDFFDPSKLTEHLSKAEKALQALKYPNAANLVAASSQLITENVKREEKYSVVLSDKNVRETFIWAVANDNSQIMDSLKKQHKLSEKQLFYWTAEGLAQSAKWKPLEQFIRTKKSTSGYLFVIEVCCKYRNTEMGKALFDKLSVYTEQIRALLIFGEVEKAAHLAAEKRDMNTLQNIRRKLPINSEMWHKVSKIMQDTRTSTIP